MSSQMPVRHRFSVTDFHRLGEAGIIGAEDRVELIDAELIAMAPMGSWHASIVALLHEQLLLGLAGQAIVSSQTPLVLGEYSEPKPDILVLRPRQDRYRDGLPRPEDVHLLIEVADTTARYDDEYKMPLYARHGVAEVWVVDRGVRELRVHRQPLETGRYGELRTVSDGRLAPGDFAAVEVDVSALF